MTRVFTLHWPDGFRPEPLEGPMRRSLVMASVVGLVVLFSKHLSLPETALSAYLVFFATRDNAITTMGTAAALILAAFLAIGLLIVMIMAVGGEPALRIPLMFGITFLCMLLASGMTNGVIAATLGMVLFEVLSGLDILPYPDLALRGLFWVTTIVILPMGILFLAHLLAGERPTTLVQTALNERIDLIRASIQAPAEPARIKACQNYLTSGRRNLASLRRLMKADGRHLTGIHLAAWAEDETAQMLAGCAAGCPPEDKTRLHFDRSPPTDTPEADLEPAMVAKRDIRFALTATLSVALCYTVFLLMRWPEIHTITITAFLVSLSSPGETIHKASLRIAGCVIGGLISFAALFWVVPHLESAAQLALLCALVALPAAWIALSGELVAYVGMQIALVFFLTVCNSTGPHVDFGVAWGRFAGILLGNLIVSATFITLGRGAPAVRLREALARLRNRHQDRIPGQPGDGLVMLGLLDALHDLREHLTRERFDPTLGPAGHAELEAVSAEMNNLASAVIGLPPDGTEDPSIKPANSLPDDQNR